METKSLPRQQAEAIVSQILAVIEARENHDYYENMSAKDIGWREDINAKRAQELYLDTQEKLTQSFANFAGETH